MSGDKELLENFSRSGSHEKVFSYEDKIKDMAAKIKMHRISFLLQRIFLPYCPKGALKLKEITYIHGEGYAAVN
jgi:glucosamine--fructose-6-phosphate aminotransferase (isomerizing)